MIYYCFEKATGRYAGSGTPLIENATHSCTTVPAPSYDSEAEVPYWDGESWSLVPLDEE